MTPLVLIKIGGSLITDKTKPYCLNPKALTLICQEIRKSQKTGKKLIVGHGAGSFAHIPAQKYQTHKGIINKQSQKGIAEVADMAAQLNRIVIRELIKNKVNAVSVSPLSIMLAKNHELLSIHPESLEEILKLDLVPVVYGDQIIDTQVGCTIFSTERVLGYLGLAFLKKGYILEKIIHCGQTSGVYDQFGQTMPLISDRNFAKIEKIIGQTKGVDVTGGMLHKIKESLSLAKIGIPGLIIDGINKGKLSDAVAGKKVIGTEIQW